MSSNEEYVKASDLYKKMKESIAESGWSVISTSSEEENITYSYTVGIYETYGLPEFVVVGLSQDVACSIIVEMVERIENGETLETMKRYKSTHKEYEDDEFILIDIHEDRKKALMLIMDAYYGFSFDDVKVMQILWQDDNNRYPFQHACDDEAIRAQQLLGIVEMARLR